MKSLLSFQTKILLSFIGLILVLTCLAILYSQIDNKNKGLDLIVDKVDDLKTDYHTNTRHFQDFLLFGYHDEAFYKTGSQPDIDAFTSYLGKNDEIIVIKKHTALSGNRFSVVLDSLLHEKQKLLQFVTEIKDIYYKKGFKDFGIEGQMRDWAHALENSSLIPELEVLRLRRSEKDFSLRGEQKYADAVLKLADSLIIRYHTNKEAGEALIRYRDNFQSLVEYNNRIGILSADGLYKRTEKQLLQLDQQYDKLAAATAEGVSRSKKRNDIILYSGALFIASLTILFLWVISRLLSREVKRLNGIMLNYIHSGFTPDTTEQFAPKTLEIHTLYRSYKLLKEKLKRMLDEKAGHQKMLVSAVVEGQEKERKNIGAELHDNINPMLATAILYLNMASREEDKFTHIKSSITIIEDSIQEIRKLSHSLVGPVENDFVLRESLNDLLCSLEQGVSFQISFSAGPLDENKISDEKKLILYRIVQEQMNNVIKYAQAEKVLVSIQQNGNELLLAIKDNGVGFDTTKKAKGIGLRNIETRLELINGNMVLNTKPGDGCEMIVAVPV
ncbi:MAG TPA: sensor histidine kinase [Chitinophagaceae bacterium]